MIMLLDDNIKEYPDEKEKNTFINNNEWQRASPACREPRSQALIKRENQRPPCWL